MPTALKDVVVVVVVVVGFGDSCESPGALLFSAAPDAFMYCLLDNYLSIFFFKLLRITSSSFFFIVINYFLFSFVFCVLLYFQDVHNLVDNAQMTEKSIPMLLYVIHPSIQKHSFLATRCKTEAFIVRLQHSI